MRSRRHVASVIIGCGFLSRCPHVRSGHTPRHLVCCRGRAVEEQRHNPGVPTAHGTGQRRRHRANVRRERWQGAKIEESRGGQVVAVGARVPEGGAALEVGRVELRAAGHELGNEPRVAGRRGGHQRRAARAVGDIDVEVVGLEEVEHGCGKGLAPLACLGGRRLFARLDQVPRELQVAVGGDDVRLVLVEGLACRGWRRAASWIRAAADAVATSATPLAARLGLLLLLLLLRSEERGLSNQHSTLLRLQVQRRRLLLSGEAEVEMARCHHEAKRGHCRRLGSSRASIRLSGGRISIIAGRCGILRSCLRHLDGWLAFQPLAARSDGGKNLHVGRPKVLEGLGHEQSADAWLRQADAGELLRSRRHFDGVESYPQQFSTFPPAALRRYSI